MTAHAYRSRSKRRGAAAPLALAAALLLLAATPALAARAPVVGTPALPDGSATGAAGQRLTVSATDDLDPAGQVLTVSGSGYDEGKGIYVAFCVDNGPDQLPTPCGGGVDTAGGSGSSQWISSDPPSYGEGLAVPYGSGGSFTVQLAVSATIGDSVDCRRVTCAVVTRADHTRSQDRSEDVEIPLAFTSGAASGGVPVWWWPAGGAAVLVAVGAGFLATRRHPR